MDASLSNVKARKLSTHPFYPPSLHLPHYVPNTISDQLTLASFGLACACLIAGSYLAIGPRVPFMYRLLFTWSVFSGSIHLFQEGYFVLFWSSLPSLNSWLACVWKEYAKCDSRYLTGDSTVWIVEFLTAFIWGPLLYYVAACIYTGYHKTHRYAPWLLCLSVGQLYGVIVYFATSLFLAPPTVTKFPDHWLMVMDFMSRLQYGHGDPHPYFFWFYFVFMNSVWVAVPLLCCVWCLKTLSRDPSPLLRKKRN